MNNAFLASLIFAGVAFASGAASAHDDAALAAQKAPNGGQLRQAGPFHYELVVAKDATEAKESAVIVYVTDHEGKKVQTVGASGTATLLAGKQKASAALKPDGDNRLKGSARYTASADMKAIIAVTIAGKAAEQARFTPLAASAGGAALAAANDGHSDHRH